MKYLLFTGIQSLKEIDINIPQGVRIGETITLQCKYDLEDEPLYTVKWYKGSKEFYRFIPKELPNTKVFPLPGIDVDVSIFFFKFHFTLYYYDKYRYIFFTL